MRHKLDDGEAEWGHSMSISGFKISCFLVLFLVASCSTKSQNSTADNMACDFNGFFNMSDFERVNLIEKCPPEDQVELYLAWSGRTIPDNTEYAEVIARAGEKLLSAILVRLERSDQLSDQIQKPELLLVLEIMQQKKYYDVVSDKKFIGRVGRAAGAIPEKHLREWALEIYTRLVGK